MSLLFRTRLQIELDPSKDLLVSFYPMDQTGPLTSLGVLEVKVTDSKKNQEKERKIHQHRLEKKLKHWLHKGTYNS